MVALVQKENNVIHVLTLFLEKVYHAPDVQNILQKPVVWGHHSIIEEVFLFLQWGYSLTPFLTAALHLSHTPVLWDQQIRYLPGYVGGNLMLLTSSSCGFWLRPCLHTPISTGPSCLFLGRLCKLPLCGEHCFLIKISLWDLTDYPNLYWDCNFPMSCEILSNPSYWIYCVIAGLLLVPHCQVMVRGMTVWAYIQRY